MSGHASGIPTSQKDPPKKSSTQNFLNEIKRIPSEKFEDGKEELSEALDQPLYQKNPKRIPFIESEDYLENFPPQKSVRRKLSVEYEDIPSQKTVLEDSREKFPPEKNEARTTSKASGKDTGNQFPRAKDSREKYRLQNSTSNTAMKPKDNIKRLPVPKDSLEKSPLQKNAMRPSTVESEDFNTKQLQIEELQRHEKSSDQIPRHMDSREKFRSDKKNVQYNPDVRYETYSDQIPRHMDSREKFPRAKLTNSEESMDTDGGKLSEAKDSREMIQPRDRNKEDYYKNSPFSHHTALEERRKPDDSACTTPSYPCGSRPCFNPIGTCDKPRPVPCPYVQGADVKSPCSCLPTSNGGPNVLPRDPIHSYSKPRFEEGDKHKLRPCPYRLQPSTPARGACPDSPSPEVRGLPPCPLAVDCSRHRSTQQPLHGSL